MNSDKNPHERTAAARLGLPSKGRLSIETLNLLNDCQLPVKQTNPRQYFAEIPQISSLQVWFQRPKDIVRKLISGDLDLGIVGYDTVIEYGQGNEDLIVVHDALQFGDCQLCLAIPNWGIFENVNSLKDLAEMPLWTAERPLRIATGFMHLASKFIKEKGLKLVVLSTADGAIEASPSMGIADAIIDLVSSGTTLKDNNLKKIEGGVIAESQAVFVANRKSLLHKSGVLDITREMLERFEARLKGVGQFMVMANMRGSSAEDVADKVLTHPLLSPLQGGRVTVSPGLCKHDGKVSTDYYGVVIRVAKQDVYESVKQLRQMGGGGLMILPLTYIFDEETPRWRQLVLSLGQ